MEQTKQTVDRQPDEMKAERTTGSTHRICTHRLRRHVRNITHDGRCHFAQTTNTRPVIYAHLPLLCCVHKIASHIAENKKRKTKNTHKPQSYRMHKMSYHWAHRGLDPIPVYIRFFFHCSVSLAALLVVLQSRLRACAAHNQNIMKRRE